MKKKVCKTCKLFVEGDTCPLCKRDQWAQSWQGKIVVVDHESSSVAKMMGFTANGEYAIKVR
jgi:RNA polymerase subunit RPABC4/transcription elongation factor Spt4